jgi:three-Cys-motif partner protein
MPTPREVLWKRDPHTEAKHRVYRAYFNAWFPILLQSRLTRDGAGVTYAEGFSGPGEYEDRSQGSPLIALRSALNCLAPPSPSRPARFLLLEENPARVDHLRHLLEKELGTLDPVELHHRGLVVDPRQGQCGKDLPALLDEHRAWGKPMLVVLDTWGSAVDFALLQRIGNSKAAEAVVTIQPSQFFRFAADPDHYGDRVFGPVVWRDVQREHSNEKADYIRTQYRRVLNEAGFRYVLDFQLADEKSNLLYLVYGTNAERGVEKMKEAIWAVDPYHGVGYRDPRDPDQETLAIEPIPQTAALRRLLVEHLATLPHERATVDALRQFVLLDTIYKPSQTLRAVKRLIEDGTLARVNPTGQLNGASLVALTGQGSLL